MLESQIIKDSHFEELGKTKIRVGTKNWVTLGEVKIKTGTYKMYRNFWGQIILDPLATVSAHEQWLFKNKKAMQMLKAGLKAACEGKLVKAREDYSKYID